MVTTNIQVWNSLAHTDIFMEQKILTFWCGDNPIALGVVVNDVSIFIKFRNEKQVFNTLLIEPELP